MGHDFLDIFYMVRNKQSLLFDLIKAFEYFLQVRLCVAIILRVLEGKNFQILFWLNPQENARSIKPRSYTSSNCVEIINKRRKYRRLQPPYIKARPPPSLLLRPQVPRIPNKKNKKNLYVYCYYLILHWSKKSFPFIKFYKDKFSYQYLVFVYFTFKLWIFIFFVKIISVNKIWFKSKMFLLFFCKSWINFSIH